MILGHFELTEPIELREGEISTVVIENPMLYRRFVCAMLDQSVGESDEFRLSDENGELEFGKNVCVITDVFNISFNTRAVSVKLLQEYTSAIVRYREAYNRTEYVCGRAVLYRTC